MTRRRTSAAGEFLERYDGLLVAFMRSTREGVETYLCLRSSSQVPDSEMKKHLVYEAPPLFDRLLAELPKE